MSIIELNLKEQIYTLKPFELKLYNEVNQNEASTKMKHLIITGINGSGKTTLLREIANELGATRRISNKRLELKFDSENQPACVAFLEAIPDTVPDAGGDYMSTSAYLQWEANEAHNLVLALMFYLEGNWKEAEDDSSSECLKKLEIRYENLLRSFWSGLEKIFQLSSDQGVRFGIVDGEKRFNYLECFDKRTGVAIKNPFLRHSSEKLHVMIANYIKILNIN